MNTNGKFWATGYGWVTGREYLPVDLGPPLTAEQLGDRLGDPEHDRNVSAYPLRRSRIIEVYGQ